MKKKIFVAGGTGFLGRRICKKLEGRKINYCQTSLNQGVDFRNKKELVAYVKREKPDMIINCAAFVGGIQFGYKYPVEMFRNNLLMAINLLECSKEFNIKRIINPIANCTYPARAALFREEGWWDGPMHESVMTYGFVRKGFWIGSWAYNKQFGLDCINLILSNMYGPGDHFDEERSHALGALIMKFINAKEKNDPKVVVWGSGSPVREWLYVDDGAEALVRAIDITPHLEPINVGEGKGISIADLANVIKEETNYRGNIVFDKSKPDGAPYKTVDGTKGKRILEWEPQMDLRKGIKETIKWYRKNKL